jgi:hypothetical protein
MKRFLTLALLSTWTLSAAAQSPQAFIASPGMPGQIQAKPSPDWVPIDLDFPGGTPLELVKAIEKSLGTNVNVIIAAEHANYRIPPFRVNQVSVTALFSSLRRVSDKYVQVRVPGTPGVSTTQTYHHNVGYGFTTDNSSTPGGRFLWRFQVTEAPPEPEAPKSCKFFQLAPTCRTTSVSKTSPRPSRPAGT